MVGASIAGVVVILAVAALVTWLVRRSRARNTLPRS